MQTISHFPLFPNANTIPSVSAGTPYEPPGETFNMYHIVHVQYSISKTINWYKINFFTKNKIQMLSMYHGKIKILKYCCKNYLLVYFKWQDSCDT